MGVWKQQNKFIFIPLQCVIAAVYFSGCSTENARAEQFSLLPQTGCSTGVFSGDGRINEPECCSCAWDRGRSCFFTRKQNPAARSCPCVQGGKKKKRKPSEEELEVGGCSFLSNLKSHILDFFFPCVPISERSSGTNAEKDSPGFLSSLLPLTGKCHKSLVKTRGDSRSVAVVLTAEGRAPAPPDEPEFLILQGCVFWLQ